MLRLALSLGGRDTGNSGPYFFGSHRCQERQTAACDDCPSRSGAVLGLERCPWALITPPRGVEGMRDCSGIDVLVVTRVHVHEERCSGPSGSAAMAGRLFVEACSAFGTSHHSRTGNTFVGFGGEGLGICFTPSAFRRSPCKRLDSGRQRGS
jgi:hypothetical protein